MKYLVLAYYLFVEIEDPAKEVQIHKDFLQSKDTAGRIYISTEGINGQMSALESDAVAYMQWLKSRPLFSKIKFKIHRHHENAFPRMTIKVRKQLVAIDIPVDMSLGGTHISPAKWKKMLQEEKDVLLLDVRNRYEWEIGHFEKSTLPPLENFREFPQYADSLKKTCDPKKTKVMMCCTGGIRCELFSAVMKEKGFENVYQLDGGLIQYGLDEGSDYWKGKVFVFDDRLAVTIDGKTNSEETPIARCSHCNCPSDTYYNCANMDCNELFLSCPTCIEKSLGCCCSLCQQSPRLRPFVREGGNKPFRRKHLISKSSGSVGESDPESPLSPPSSQA